MSYDRLSPVDSTFLHVEDGVSHMHVGSIGIFEGRLRATRTCCR